MALVNIAFCCTQTGNPNQAKEYYGKALNQFPDSEMAKSALQMMNCGNNAAAGNNTATNNNTITGNDTVTSNDTATSNSTITSNDTAAGNNTITNENAIT